MKLKPIEFIKIYRQAESLEELSRITGMNIKAIQARATRYRKRGIDLPYFSLPTGRGLEELKEQVSNG